MYGTYSISGLETRQICTVQCMYCTVESALTVTDAEIQFYFGTVHSATSLISVDLLQIFFMTKIKIGAEYF